MSLGWSEADDAELDVVADHFVRAVRHHQRNCRRCMGLYPCEAIRDAEVAVLEWVYSRRLLSKAEFLREALESQRPPKGPLTDHERQGYPNAMDQPSPTVAP